MDQHELTRLKGYLVSFSARMRLFGVTFGIFLLVFATFILANPLALVFPVLFGLIAMVYSLPAALRQRKKSLKELESTGQLDDALQDFRLAQEAEQVGLVGEKYFFGLDTGVIVAFSEVSRIVRDDEEIYDPDAAHAKRIERTVKFVLHNGTPLMLCRLYNRHQYQRAAKALSLMKDKCEMCERSQALLEQYDV